MHVRESVYAQFACSRECAHERVRESSDSNKISLYKIHIKDIKDTKDIKDNKGTCKRVSFSE